MNKMRKAENEKMRKSEEDNMRETKGDIIREPKEDNIQQGFSSWKTSSSEWKYFWKHQFALISHNILLKTYTFNFYKHKSLRIFF